MKNFTLTFFILLQALFSFAQRDPSKEILVFFKEGVEQSEKLLNGKLEKAASLKKDGLKVALKKAGIEEGMLEIAMPHFLKADTLRTLTDGTTVQQLDMTKLFRIKVPEGKSKKELLEKLRTLPEVLYAEENGTISPFLIPSDVWYTEQWALNNPINPGADIHAQGAWDIFTGNPDNIIAVIDGGTDVNHPDLNDKIAGADAGFGWGGHGIHVSGIAAAESNNAQGVSGVDWQAKILARRIDNLSDDADTYQAIVDAVNFSPYVRVLNHSWGLTSGIDNQGRPIPGRYSTTIAQAFAIAYKANRVSVAAMGNHQQTYPGVVNFPAGFNNVIAVGATDNADVIANFSVQGNNIDVSAPGVGILSTLTNNDYINMDGTSMASPHVSGIASLLKGFNTALANDDIENIINLSADDVNFNAFPGYDQQMGHGRVNAAQALGLLQAPNSVNQFTASGGTVAGTTSNYTAVFYATSGLAPGTYVVKRYEVTRAVTFPYSFCNIVGAWGRGVGTAGYSVANPNYGEGFCEVVPGTLTNTSATLRTYVYEVFNTLGQSMGYYPTTPSNVTFAYTVLGQANNYSISGPDNFCSNGTYSIPNLPAGATVSWSVTPSGMVSISTSNNVATVTALNNGQITLTATVNSACGNIVLPALSINVIGTIAAKPVEDLYHKEYHCDTWNECFNGGRIFHQAQAAAQTYTYTVGSPWYFLDANGQPVNAITLNASETPPLISLPSGNTRTFGTYTVKANNCFGSSQELILPFVREADCWCDGTYPSPYADGVINTTCVTPPCGGGMDRIEGTSLVIYPNPASEELTVVNKDEEKERENNNASSFSVQLFNGKGQVLKETASRERSAVLDVSNISEGTYYLHIRLGRELIRKQVIIKH